jgi:hypothetical protein
VVISEADPADTHCVGLPPQPVSQASCMPEAGIGTDAADAVEGGDDSGPPGDSGLPGDDSGSVAGDSGKPQPGPCGENGPDYGATMFGTQADDDDCKYAVSYSVGGICENEGVFFTVTASYLTTGAPLTGAYTYAELCLNDTHPAPPIDSIAPQGHQSVTENPPGTYKVGPVQFDAPGQWTVRFHFNELCDDVLPDSPHGHAAFFVDVP